MIAYPAIDLRNGLVVQLVGGEPGSERVVLPDPVAVAEQWIECGFRALHVVDLDAALDTGANDGAVRGIIAAAQHVPVQVGGGVRTTARVSQLIEEGAAAVIVGTRAVQEPGWLEVIALRWPDRIVVAADVRGETVVVRGWTASSGVSAEDLIGRLETLPLAGILVTDVTREGRMVGPDVERFRQLVATTPHRLIASGGIAGAADLARLAATGVAGAVLGMALYTGALDPPVVAGEYRT
jgi:phosphoribosylformimino-5-aminoimidazole carboxamide ribotide isomerase